MEKTCAGVPRTGVFFPTLTNGQSQEKRGKKSPPRRKIRGEPWKNPSSKPRKDADRKGMFPQGEKRKERKGKKEDDTESFRFPRKEAEMGPCAR